MIYLFEQKISTLAQNALPNKNIDSCGFEIDGIELAHWGFNASDGWTDKAWLARAEVEAVSFDLARQSFYKRLARIVPRVSFISQCYAEYYSQPILVTRSDLDVAFFRCTKDRGSVPLMFCEEELHALKALLSDDAIPDAFFYYWNDAVNAVGYTAKLLLMFAAIETLVRRPDGTKDFSIRKKILGDSLAAAIYKQPNGIRHRLAHGEYFSGPDSDVDYLEVMHKKVMAFFNGEVLKNEWINNDVVAPQRHLFGNIEVCNMYIGTTAGADLNLKDVLSDFASHGMTFSQRYPYLDDEATRRQFVEAKL